MNGLWLGSSRSFVSLKVVINIQTKGNAAKPVKAAITPKCTTLAAQLICLTPAATQITSERRDMRRRVNTAGAYFANRKNKDTAPPARAEPAFAQQQTTS